MPTLARRQPLDQKGQMILWVLVILFLIGIGISSLIQVLRSRHEYISDDDERFEASLLAADILELGKYYLLYEKYFYRDNPVNQSGDRADCMRRVWSQELFEDTVDPCGTYNDNVRYTGDNIIKCPLPSTIPARIPSFCPWKIKHASLDGAMLEQQWLGPWANRNIVTRVKDGVYSLEMSLKDAVTPYRQGDNMIRLFTGQKLLLKHLGAEDASLAGWLGADAKFDARLKFDFFSDSSSFVPISSERYVKITGSVEFSGAKGLVHRVQRSNTLMMWLSTPKDFSLFVPYPTDSTGASTDVFTSAMVFASTTEIHGRVYFNGDIKGTLTSLPTFFEAVAISGNIKKADGSIPGAADLVTLKSKFRKGFITNYSAGRFVKDGHCEPNGVLTNAALPNTFLDIANKTRINCFDEETVNSGAKDDFFIKHYIVRLKTACSKKTITVNQGSITTATSSPNPGAPYLDVDTSNDCGFPSSYNSSSERFTKFLSGGFHKVIAKGVSANILSPVEIFTVPDANTVVFGSIFGGYIQANGSNQKFYSLAALTPDINKAPLSGASGDTNLVKMNTNQLSSYEGMTVPLLNTPIVLITGDDNG